ncbi:hypothetical protein NLJ89_g3791 [Agrocybe chaxingu]|uniref:F-box domain-containing protein n=1 Tax=Agrocybe chaxingu TaxID=84603 RepID=A0A9W8K4K3_9AGAR|nr:hypothetical protein NLJ89_g3791 [Agrocybe chaxingu]
MPYIFQSSSSQTFSAGGMADVISSMRISLTKKQKPRIDLESLRAQNSTIPVSSIPVELLRKIFDIYVYEPYPAKIGFRSMEPDSGGDPLLLGQICSYWRNVAVNSSSLWSTVVVSQPTDRHIHLVNLWLERAAERPLDVTFNQPDNVTSAWTILNAFVSRSRFWRRIDLTVPLELLSHFAVLLQSPRRCDMLEHVDFFTRSPISGQLSDYDLAHPAWRTNLLRQIWSFFYTSPSLSSVYWVDGFQSCVHEHVPFAQMTSIHLNTLARLNAEDTIAFMRLFPNLRSLTTTISSSSSSSSLPLLKPSIHTYPISLAQLETLHLVVHIPISTIFSSITLPSLHCLRLVSVACQQPLFPDSTVLDDFFCRSNCQLVTLNYVDPHVAEPCLQKLLAMPALQSLTYFDCDGRVTDSTILSLMRRNPNGRHSLIPRLEELYFMNCDTTDIAVSDMVSSRIPALKVFQFYSEREGRLVGPTDWYY